MLEGRDRGGIHRMRHAYVIGVNDQQLGIARVSKLFCQRQAVALCISDGRSTEKGNRQQLSDVLESHRVPISGYWQDQKLFRNKK
jgi:hypothetical protein